MKTNAIGLSIIKHFESCRLVPYKDPELWTVGWGHLIGVPKDLQMDQVLSVLVSRGIATPDEKNITQAMADSLLASDLSMTEVGILKSAKVTLTSNQFSALVSLAFNIGLDEIQGSSLWRFTNSKRFDEASTEFHRWIHQDGKILDGLVYRRATEAWLFSTPDFPELS